MASKNPEKEKRWAGLPVDALEAKHLRAMFLILLVLQSIIGIASYREYSAARKATNDLHRDWCDSTLRYGDVNRKYFDAMAYVFGARMQFAHAKYLVKVLKDREAAAVTLEREATKHCNF
jgi:hypothetical protein